MKIEELSHLPVEISLEGVTLIIDGKDKDGREHTRLPQCPLELAEIDFNGRGVLRPVYVNGIMMTSVNPDKYYLIYTVSRNLKTGEGDGKQMAELEKITFYKTIIKLNS